MGRSRRAAVPRARECKSKQSNKLVGLCSFFSCLHTKIAGGNAKQPKVDIKLAKVIEEMCKLLPMHYGAIRKMVLYSNCFPPVLA